MTKNTAPFRCEKCKGKIAFPMTPGSAVPSRVDCPKCGQDCALPAKK